MPKPQVELPPLRLSPASLPAPLALQQQLHFRFGSHERDLDALLEADAQRVQLAVQAMGQTGVRLQWDGQQLTQQRAPWLPPQVRAERVLDDLQFALADRGHRRSAAGPLGGHRRRPPAQLVARGTVWLLLQRLDDGSMQLDNRAEGYALRIESIDMAGQDR